MREMINQVIQGDCLEAMPQLPAHSVDLILTDLPYGTTQNKWDCILPLEEMWRQIKRVLKPTGIFITTASQPFTSNLIMSNLSMFKYTWVWEKDKAANILNAKKQVLKIHEDIVVFSSGQGIYNPQMVDCKPYKHKNRNIISTNFGSNSSNYDPNGYALYDKAYPKSIIRFAKPGGNRGATHPTQKPIALFEYLIKTYSNEGDLVLDITAGSGTTGIAALNTNRNFILIEKEAEYIDIINRRLANLQPTMQSLFSEEMTG